MLAAVMTPAPAAAQDNAPGQRGGGGDGTRTGNFALELDGKHAGWLLSAEGGHAVAEVIEERTEGSLLHKKHIGGVKYEDITVTFGLGMGPGLFDWLKGTFDGKAPRKNGAIVAADFNYKETSRLHFFGALVTEIGFPALDATSKEPAYMVLKFSPDFTQSAPPSPTPLPPPAAGQKKWLPSNFKITIDGLDTSRVNKIEALTIKQKVTENAVGEMRDYEQEATSVEVPNLVITLAESHARPFYDWHEDFVIKGNNDESKEKGGTLQWLEPNGRTPLGSLTISNIGIFKITADKVESGSEGIRRVKAEMYCEDIRFSNSGDGTPR